ncbi:MAG: hypothetical protein AB7F74_19925, partial [Parvibaculaceae bacterium]
MACAICFSGLIATVGQKLDAADQAVLALPLADGGQFRIVDVIKGDIAGGGTVVEAGLSREGTQLMMTPDGVAAVRKAPAPQKGETLLLLRNRLSKRWTNAGAIDGEFGPWLRQLAAAGRGDDDRPAGARPFGGQASDGLSESEWRDRVALVAPHLESADPLAAEIAYGEIARAPYGALRSLRPSLDAVKIAKWIDDPALASRRSAYTLLLGIAGGVDEAAGLEQRLDAAWTAQDAANLSAMLAADLEIRGPGRVAWVEAKYLADRKRTLPEIEAALLGLSVHGRANAAVPRERVIAAYRFFIKEHRPMAGFVAPDLAEWGAWEATADYMAILQSKVVKDPASEFMIARFIEQSP